ncbi:MAG: transcriptional repressor [Actinomycetia bacterium]|nr:transcriptional repressor [Actinomycetes bacterium]
MPSDTIRRLKRVGLRVTAPRRTVLEVLAEHPHSTAATVESYTRDRIGHVSTQAIYDVLAACTRTGLVRRIEPAGSAALYETRTGDNHHHLVCRSCGDVHDIDCVVGERPCLTPESDVDFEITSAEVVFWGYCPRCRERSPDH